MQRPSREALKRHLERLQDSLPAALLNRFIEIDLLTQAASLAFYAVLSLAPLLVLLLWLSASLYPAAQDELVGQIGQLVGSEAEAMTHTVIANAQARPSVGSLAGVWGTLLLFIGATAVFARLQAALNLIFRTDAQRLDTLLAWLRKRVFSFGVVFAVGFLLMVSMTLATALQVVLGNVPSLLPLAGNLASLGVYVVSFAFLYRFLPDRPVHWRQAFLGGLNTALLFTAGRYLIGAYIATTDPGGAYGSASALVILLVWIYYASVVFFVGALLTAVVDERARSRATLEELGVEVPQVAEEP